MSLQVKEIGHWTKNTKQQGRQGCIGDEKWEFCDKKSIERKIYKKDFPWSNPYKMPSIPKLSFSLRTIRKNMSRTQWSEMLFPPFNGINLHPSMVLNPRCYKFNFRCFSKCLFSPCFTLKNIPGPCSFSLSPCPFPDMGQPWYSLYAVEHLLSGHLQPPLLGGQQSKSDEDFAIGFVSSIKSNQTPSTSLPLAW